MEDVVLGALGPGADRVHGYLDNTEVFRIIADALGLGQGAPAATGHRAGASAGRK